jgi:intein/homing endonuclease
MRFGPAKVPGFSPSFAYFLGYLLGDGSVSMKRPTIALVCHSIEENQFCRFVLVPLVTKLFGIKPTLYKRKDKNAYTVQFDSRRVVTHLANEIRFPIGETPKTVPKVILRGATRIKIAFVRGYFDADGSLIFSKKTYSKHVYPSIELKCVYFAVLADVQVILRQFGFRTSIGRSVESWVLRINGVEMLKRWMRIIGSDNIKHNSKYSVWRELGYCPPDTTVRERLDMLQRVLNAEKTNIDSKDGR